MPLDSNVFKRVSRLQNVTDADVGAIKNAKGNVSLLLQLTIYTIYNLCFKTSA